MGRTYSLVKVDGVFAGDDIRDRRSRFLLRRLLSLSLGIVFGHCEGLSWRRENC